MQIEKLLEEQEKDFNEKFKCIQDDCDGSGCIPVAKTVGRQVGDYEFVEDVEWVAEQCEFHAVYLYPIKDWHKQSLKQFIDGLIESRQGLESNYPVKIFSEPKGEWQKELHEWCKERGFAIDNISAYYGRWQENLVREEILSHLKEITKQLE